MAEDDNQCNMKEESKVICYTPERLIRSQEYRILVPSPRHFTLSQARLRSENESGERKSRCCRKQLDCLIDSKQIGATQLRALLNLPITGVRTHVVSSSVFERADGDFNTSVRSSDDHPVDRDRSARSTGTISSSRSSYDRLNSTWDDFKDPISRPLSLEDTSGIQSNDWSLETQSDARSTPMCLCDELAIASRDRIVNFRNDRDIVINEVTAILENLQSDPEKARILLEEEDSFCDSTSSHDRLTRLALAIETDAEVPPTVSESNNWIRHLRDKIERLELGNKEIHRNIHGLRTNFQTAVDLQDHDYDLKDQLCSSDLKCDSPERLTLDAELTDEAIDKGVIMEKSEASEDLAARCESILAVGRTHANEELANEDRPSSLALSVRRCLACILGLPLLPRPKCRSSKCLLRFLDWRRIAPHNGHDAG
ncbi:hypothetical protein RF55_4238 [Lasius niger]|uniref:Uncharacterized protein n=1 Tax=Lasius niger TaxID=67767 RepID=A0A0J7NSZ2_LASNI|nr:hypothetical protein RF55_4238 [Lasius niger]